MYAKFHNDRLRNGWDITLWNFAKTRTNKHTNERALRECILCKIGLTDWVAYLVDWQWQRSRTQSIGPNDSNERCAISRVLFRINIAAITENTWPWPFTSDLDLFPLTFDLDIWPWDWSIITLMLWRKHYKNVLFWRHVTQKRHLIC